MTDFPLLRSAMAERQFAFDAARDLGWRPGRDRPIEERLAWKAKDDAREAAYRKVCDAYASELLPAILGGEWAKTNHSLYVSKPSLYVRPSGGYLAGCHHDLFDHPLHFRRRGAKGPLTTKNCALIGQPYPPGPQQGDQAALQLANQFGLGLWRRDDLSAWYPSVTILVIAAIGLTHQNAPKFGFTPLNDPKPGTGGDMSGQKTPVSLGVSSPSPLSTGPYIE